MVRKEQNRGYKRKDWEKLISLIVKKEKCSNNGTWNTDVNYNYFIKKWRNFAEKQLPVSVCNGLEFWLQKEERRGATFCKGNMEKGYPQTIKHWWGSPVVCNKCLSKNKMQAQPLELLPTTGKRKLKRLTKEQKKFLSYINLLRTKNLLSSLCFFPTAQQYPALQSLWI